MNEITVTISGTTGSGKSAIAGEIEVALKALGVPVVWKDADREHWHHGNEYWIDLYKPEVTIIEQNIPRQSAPSADVANYIEALTPSASTKAAYISEFHFTVPDGSGERRVTVPWNTIKQIMSAIREKAIS